MTQSSEVRGVKEDLDEIVAHPLPPDQQDKCQHDYWLCYIGARSGKRTCLKCGHQEPMIDEDWDTF